MLKNIYRVMVMAQAVSASIKMLQNLTDTQLAGAGIDRGTHAKTVMQQIEVEFAAQDAQTKAAIEAVVVTNVVHQAV